MKIIVSFEKTEEGFKSPEGIASSLAGKFLSSLRLDPEMWMHAQECELDPRMGARVFGIDNSPIPLGLLDCSKWVCRFEGRQGFTLLQVNGIPWGIDPYPPHLPMTHAPFSIPDPRKQIPVSKSGRRIPIVTHLTN